MIANAVALNFYIVLVWLTVSVFFGFASPLVIVFNLVFRLVSPSRSVRKLIRFYGWVLVRLVSLFVPVELENRSSSLPLPAVFVANHCSAIDPYLFGLLACENAFITSWPFRIPIHSLVMRMAEYVDARDGWEEIERRGKLLLDKGCSVTVWPEGHRSRDGYLQRFRKGAFKLAVVAGRPVIPVCIVGSGEVLPPERFFFRSGSIRVIVLPAVVPEGDGDIEEVTERLMREVHRRIAEELAAWAKKS